MTLALPFFCMCVLNECSEWAPRLCCVTGTGDLYLLKQTPDLCSPDAWHEKRTRYLKLGLLLKSGGRLTELELRWGPGLPYISSESPSHPPQHLPVLQRPPPCVTSTLRHTYLIGKHTLSRHTSHPPWEAGGGGIQGRAGASKLPG